MAHTIFNGRARRTAFGAALSVAGMLALSTSAGAVTVTAEFDLTGNGYAWSPSYTVGGLTMDIAGYSYDAQNFSDEEGESVDLLQQIGTRSDQPGMGACTFATSPSDTNCGSRPTLDGRGEDAELLSFTFSQEVFITGVLFANNDSNDLVDIFAGDDLEYVLAGNTPLPPERLSLSGFGALTRFAVGNQDFSDQYRIAAISVSYEMIPPPPPPPPPNPVPLPAAGWMMIAGLGGLTAMRRRRRK